MLQRGSCAVAADFVLHVDLGEGAFDAGWPGDFDRIFLDEDDAEAQRLLRGGVFCPVERAF